MEDEAKKPWGALVVMLRINRISQRLFDEIICNGLVVQTAPPLVGFFRFEYPNTNDS